MSGRAEAQQSAESKSRLKAEEKQRAAQRVFEAQLKKIREDDPEVSAVDMRWQGEVGSDMVARLADSLVGNSRVTELDLSGNRIGDKGAERLARALQRCSSITLVELSGNGISSVGASWLAKALVTNTTLCTLVLDFNHRGSEGAEHLTAAMTVNRESQVALISIKGNNVQGLVEERLRNLTKANAAKPPRLPEAEVLQAHELCASAPPRPVHSPPLPPPYLGRLSINFDPTSVTSK